MSITSMTVTGTFNMAITYTSTEDSGLETFDVVGCDALPTRIAGELNQLRCGTVSLTVPILGQAIQVGSADPLPAATIVVSKTPGNVTVRRTDGSPLQAQIVTSEHDGSVSRAAVFTEPVAELGIRCLGRARGARLWVVASGERTRRRAGLFQLIETIVAFGAAKQRRMASPPELPASA
jgi:hypothetical protein